MSDSFGSKTSRSGAGPSASKSAAAAPQAPKPLRSAPVPAAKRNFPVIAFLVTGVVFLLAVLVFIAYDRLRAPNVQLTSSMPVASEVQDWNNSSRTGLAPGGGNLTAVDPVSKEAVDPNATPYKINIGSSWFYFTSEAHLKAFTDDPFRYVKVNINVKLLNDGSAPPAEGQSGDGRAAAPAEEAAAADSAALYQQIPSPQTDSAAAAGSASETAASAAGAPQQDTAGSGAPAAGQPPAAESAGGPPDASLYQQIPAPSNPEDRGSVPDAGMPPQNMNPQAPPPPPPPPPPPEGYPGVGEAIQQNTPVGMPL